MIQKFEDWLVDNPDVSLIMNKYPEEKEFVRECLIYLYDAGIKSATEYYENDRILIHQYYTKKLKELLGNDSEEIEPYSENHGKLT